MMESVLRATSEWALTARTRSARDRRAAHDRPRRGRGLAGTSDSVAFRRGTAGHLGRGGATGSRGTSFGRRAGLRRRRAGARSDRRQAITRAEEYRDRSQSEARGQVREIADAAAGQFDRIVQPAARRGPTVQPGAGRGSQSPRLVPAPDVPRDPGRAPAAVSSHGRCRPRSGPGYQPLRRSAVPGPRRATARRPSLAAERQPKGKEAGNETSSRRSLCPDRHGRDALVGPAEARFTGLGHARG